MDILSGDLQMKNDTESKRQGRKAKGAEDESVAGFHFIAFVPVNGKVWKLDGLERQPQNLGRSFPPRSMLVSSIPMPFLVGVIESEDWVFQTKPEIEERMAQYEEGQFEFAILGIVKEPLPTLVYTLAENVKSLVAATKRLDFLKPGWRDLIASSVNGESVLSEGAVTGPDTTYELTQDLIDQASLSQSVQEAILANEAAEVIACRQKLVLKQAGLRMSIKEEQQSMRSDQERAASRRHDYGPAVQTLVEILGRKDVLKEMVD